MARPVRRSASFGGLVAAIAVTLSGCDLSEPYGAPQFPFLPGYADRAGAPVLLSNDAWWQDLDDPVLDGLVTLALDGSLDLALARERVIAARASRDSVPTAALLTPSAQAGVSGGTGSDPQVSGTAQSGLSWILDPYGTRREELRAANARIDIADAEVDAARLLLLNNTANAYVRLRHDQRVLALSRAELRGRQDTLALTRTLQRAESATRLEIARSEARVAEIRSRLPGLEAAVTAGLNEIAVLTGNVPGTLPPALATALTQGSGQPVPSLSPEVGIPADLLRNRPDIRIAERRYNAAVAEIGIARADLYPRLSLSGTITLNALAGGTSSSEYFFGPVVAFPALPLGSTRAAVEARQSEARQAQVAWQSTVLGAILEVENALVEYDATSTALRAARDASRLYGEAADLTRAVFRRDEATLSDLIDAEQAVATADRTLADLRQEHALRFIALNVRLGSGHAGPTPQ